MPARKFTDDIEKQIAEEYRHGMSSVELGKKYNVGHSMILNVLKRQDVERRNLLKNYINISVADISEMMSLWHPTKNDNVDPSTVTSKNHKKCWWKCSVSDDHEWEASPYVLAHSLSTNNTGCPCCHGLKVVKSNCLATIYPKIADMWHPTKNGDLTPFNVVPGSNKIVWWKCPVADDHEWEATLRTLVRSLNSNNTGCPCCHGLKVVKSNCLETLYPEISKEWHIAKNDITPFNVVPGSHKIVWWLCSICRHEWKGVIKSRCLSGSSCSKCNESKGEKQISQILINLNIVYKPQYRFNDCRNTNPLPFDFAIFSNGNLYGLIEYHGQQHYEPIDFSGHWTEEELNEAFSKVKLHDSIKKTYCKERNIYFLEIPYWEFDDIEKFVVNFLFNCFDTINFDNKSQYLLGLSDQIDIGKIKEIL